MAGPLAGLRVIELAGLGPAPHACMVLADLGAEVVRVERPNRFELGDPARDPMLRGRRPILVDLKSAAGVAMVLDLVERADVLVEGYRPGVAERRRLTRAHASSDTARWAAGAAARRDAGRLNA